ncbi:MAG: PRC-barrel domain-containing protein [Thermoplasmata archaeon]|nr:PRC-barrel domain-containing protein [Thermoplasmata archaeon]
MMEEITDVIGCEVYTPDAIYVGNVKDVIMDLEAKRLDGLFIERPNPVLVEGSVNISVPFRWVSAVGDVVVLRYFPGFIKTGARGGDEEMDELIEA